jgi:hypothetical protein
MAQEHAIVDSIRRLHRERMDSAMRAQRRAVHTRRMAAARYGKPKQSPMFGEAPFFGYTWVFYADILAGTIVGLALFLARQQESDAPVSGWWAVGAMIAGGIGGAGVFVAFFVLAVFASVLAFFGDGLSTIALLGWTLGAMMLPLLSVMVSRRWG